MNHFSLSEVELLLKYISCTSFFFLFCSFSPRWFTFLCGIRALSCHATTCEVDEPRYRRRCFYVAKAPFEVFLGHGCLVDEQTSFWSQQCFCSVFYFRNASNVLREYGLYALCTVIWVNCLAYFKLDANWLE